MEWPTGVILQSAVWPRVRAWSSAVVITVILSEVQHSNRLPATPVLWGPASRSRASSRAPGAGLPGSGARGADPCPECSFPACCGPSLIRLRGHGQTCSPPWKTTWAVGSTKVAGKRCSQRTDAGSPVLSASPPLLPVPRAKMDRGRWLLGGERRGQGPPTPEHRGG